MTERSPVVREVNKVDHERAFKPSNPGKKGVQGTLEKFPEYKENPLKSTIRVNNSHVLNASIPT